MNITEQLWFKQAVEIAGAPVRDDGAVLTWNDSYDWHWWTSDNLRELITDWEAESHWQRHFREWLEERDYFVQPASVEPCDVCGGSGTVTDYEIAAAEISVWRYGVWKYPYSASRKNEPFACADDYLTSLCLAVAECEKK